MGGVGDLAVMQDRGELPVGLRPDAANQVVHGGHASRVKEADSPKYLQVMDDLFKSAIQFGNGPVDVGLYRHEFGGFRIGAAALRLRQKNGTFSFVSSHLALLWGDLVRVACGVLAPALPVEVLLLFRFARFLFGPKFLVSGFSAVGDLRQEFADVFDFRLGPGMDVAPADVHYLGRRHLPGFYVITQGNAGNAQFLSCLTR